MIDDEKQEKQGQQSKQELQSDRLRAEAEELLRTRPDDSSIGGRTLADIFQELQVLQIELELQNDELRIANEDLEWQRLRFAGIYDLAPVGYFILDKGGLVAEVNSAGIQLLEVSRKEIIGKPLQRYITEDSSSTVHIFFRQLSINGEKGSCRIKLKATGSKEIYAQIEGLYVDQAKQFYITVMDITESVYVRQQLDTSNERLQLAMDAALAGTWELDPETMSFEIDKFGRRFAQIAEETFKGTYASFLELIHPDFQNGS
jgi:PAS domain S-box-containing protein